MHPATSAATILSSATRTWPQRLFGRWWRRQSAARQDRFATLGPLISVLLFLAAIILAFWYLRNEEFEREQESVKRDTEIAQQQIRLRLIENQEQLVRIAREIVTRAIDHDQFLAQAASFTRERPEITNLVWINAARAPKASYSATSFPPEAGSTPDDTPASLPAEGKSSPPEQAFITARTQRQPVYSKPFVDSYGNAVFQVQVPLFDSRAFAGALIAEYSVEGLMRRHVPKEVSTRHAISVFDFNDQPLASTVTQMPGQKRSSPSILYRVPLAPANNGVFLQGHGYRTSIGLISNTLFWICLLYTSPSPRDS